MRKFARFLILALMLGALLCVTAFAEDTGAFENIADGATFTMDTSGVKFDVSYTGVTDGKQYLILMVAKDSSGEYTINDTSILYVNQAAGTDTGITFTVYPKDMVDAQILLTGGEEPLVLANYTAATTGTDVIIENIGANNNAQCTLSADGNTLNVKNDEAACVIAYTTDGGMTYTVLPATANSAGGYDYDLSALPEGATIAVAIKGDANGDGKITAADYGKIKAAALGKISIDGISAIAADSNNSGTFTAADYGKAKAVALGKTSFAW